ncbi:hypothetical protein DL98DRAFT_593916 [Cadophora sp. DSE1049]|nr:hypothetical protein DL98DRAFT_593916 [Cadophora sp. DSE1049]
MGYEEFPVTKRMLDRVKLIFEDAGPRKDKDIYRMFPGIPKQEYCLIPDGEHIIIDFHDGMDVLNPCSKTYHKVPTITKTHSMPREPAKTATSHPLPKALQIKAPTGARPRQQVFAPARSTQNAPIRAGTPHPARKTSFPQVSLNAARPPTTLPPALSRIPRPGQPKLRVDTGGLSQGPSQVPRHVNAQQAPRSDQSSLQQRSREPKSSTALQASTAQVHPVPQPVDVRSNTFAHSATGMSPQQPKPGQSSMQAGPGQGMRGSNVGEKQKQKLAHPAQSTLHPARNPIQTPLDEQRAQPTSKITSAGTPKGFNSIRTESQPQPISNTKNSFSSIF